jgi:hypothetical protein
MLMLAALMSAVLGTTAALSGGPQLLTVSNPIFQPGRLLSQASVGEQAKDLWATAAGRTPCFLRITCLHLRQHTSQS